MNLVLDNLEGIYDSNFLLDCGKTYLNLKPKNFDTERLIFLLLKASYKLDLISRLDLDPMIGFQNNTANLEIANMIKQLDSND